MEDGKAITVSDGKSLTTKTKHSFSREQTDLIKRTVAKGASDDELKLFLHIANKTGLDPFARQIYSVKRWNSDIGGFVMTTQTGIDGYRLIAERTGNYAPGKDTTFIYDDQDRKLVSATAFIMKRVGDQWFEVSATARYDEYAQMKKDGTPNVMWGTKPHIMLAKCAEGLALRRAFPAELSGIYTSEEMGEDIAEKKEIPSGSEDVLTPIELKWFHANISETGVNKDLVKIEINKRFNLSSSKDLNKSQASEIISWAKEQQVGA